MSKRKIKKYKLCFAASSGGHYEQLMMLRPLMNKYEYIIMTEKTKYNVAAENEKIYFVSQINRKEKMCIPKLVYNIFVSLKIYMEQKPDAIICTGVLAMLPMCLIMKLFGKKLIYIESFAKVTTSTQTGRFLYKFADQFYVQWDSMKKIYPNAIYLGGIY